MSYEEERLNSMLYVFPRSGCNYARLDDGIEKVDVVIEFSDRFLCRWTDKREEDSVYYRYVIKRDANWHITIAG